MKWCALMLLIMISSVAFCAPRDSTRTAERQKSKIEREKKHINKKFDQRSVQQKRKDRNALVLMAICAGVLVKSLANQE